MTALLDTFGRPLRNLRVSVTDRCNLRCAYCMPEEEYRWLPSAGILSFEELGILLEAFTEVGVQRVRLTGGEPLMRRELSTLVRTLAANPKLTDLALTTNGVLLAAQAEGLRQAGLHRVTVSLDTLQPARFLALTRRDLHRAVLEGIAGARAAGFPELKLDCVVVRGFNDDELGELIEFGRGCGAEVRFIEYMDVGGATRWQSKKVVSRAEMLEQLSRRFGGVRPLDSTAAPAQRFALNDGTVFGIISSTTQPFCRACDRSRLTADGLWLLCLYAQKGTDLKGLLRSGASRAEVVEALRQGWQSRTDRGAELRTGLSDKRDVLFGAEQLKAEPHLEMHTRGG